LKKLININASVLNSLPRPAKGEQAIEYRSKKNPRHRVLVNQHRITFAVRLCWRGKRYFKSFGTHPEMKVPLFTQLADQFIADVQSGSYKQGSHLTVQEFFEQHMVPYSKKHHRSHDSFMSRSTKALALLGDEKLTEVSRRDIVICLDKLGVNLANATINRYHSFYSKLFSLAVELEITDTNPSKGIKKLPELNTRDRILDKAELNNFYEAALAESSIFPAYALLLSLFTGMRIGNVITIKLEMIADDLSSITLPMTKSGKPQKIYLNDKAREVITTCSSLSTNEFLFPSSVNLASHITRPKACFKRIKNTMQYRGQLSNDFTIHDLRRTYASYLLLATGDIRLAQQSLGHSSISVTERYAYHQSPQLIAASEQTGVAMLPNQNKGLNDE